MTFSHSAPLVVSCGLLTIAAVAGSLLLKRLGKRTTAWIAAERARLEAERRYQALAEHSGVGIWHSDHEGRTIYTNSHMLAMLQAESADEIVGQTGERFLDPKDFATICTEHAKRLQGIASRYEVELIGTKGRRLRVLISGGPVMDAEGKLCGKIATVTDLSALKLAQHALERNEQRFRGLLENATDAISAWDAAGRIIFTSDSSERVLGYRPGEMLNHLSSDFVHPDDRASILAAIETVVRSPGAKLTVSARIRHRDDSWRSCEGVLTNLLDDPAIGGLVVNYRDVTEREATQNALRDSEARLQAFLEYSPSIMFIKDLEGRFLLVNRTFESAFALTAAEVLGRTDAELFRPEEAEKFMTDDQATLASGHPTGFEDFVTEVDGLHTTLVHKFPLRDASGNIYALGGIATDISERCRTEAALRRSEGRYRSLVDSARDAIFTISPEGVITSLNPAAEAITGWSNEKWIGQSFMPLLDAEDQPRAADYLRRVLSGERLDVFELHIRKKDGGSVPLEFTITAQRDEEAIVGVLGIGRDVTGRRGLEDQLRQSQKMESIGLLAGGVAHDFNNLLTVIQGNASLILFDENIAAEIAEPVREISTAAERAADLTKQLLAFSRRQDIQAKDLDLAEIIGSLTKMLNRLLGADIDLRFESAANLPHVRGDAGMLEQIILNLSLNARDAMPGGGRLTIHTMHRRLTAEDVQRNPEARLGDFVEIRVSDTGIGIAAEHLPHVFEPFFTTKDVGKGTGLGLATVYGIVKQHHGWIQVQTQIGAGTQFSVFLPASIQPRVSAAAPVAEPAAPSGSETILVVEDEAPLRGIVCTVLKRLGYRVLEAESGVVALEVWERHRSEIDLLFTDMVMPNGISGPQLATELRRQRPDLKILFTSGYSRKTNATAEGLLDVPHLQKPYRPTQLGVIIRNVLDGSASAEPPPPAAGIGVRKLTAQASGENTSPAWAPTNGNHSRAEGIGARGSTSAS
jgi:PAS domain S-box-containing protein